MRTRNKTCSIGLPYLPFYEGVAPPALLVEGATRAPIVADAIKDKEQSDNMKAMDISEAVAKGL